MEKSVVVLAAGKGERFPGKLFQTLTTSSVLLSTLQAFEASPSVTQILVVVQKSDRTRVQQCIEDHFRKIVGVIPGGTTRQKSLKAALQWLHRSHNVTGSDSIMVHNGSNPLVTEEDICGVFAAARRYGAAACGRPLTDTVKNVRRGFVEQTLPREHLWAFQTPQAARFDWLCAGIRKAEKLGVDLTDDVGLVELLGKKVRVALSSRQNFKITYPSDLEMARLILSDFYSIGVGEDSHAYDRGKGLTLGGVFFPHFQKLRANSDGDIILHALFNALSSALSGKSLGATADSLLAQKGITASRHYLQPLFTLMGKKHLGISHVVFSIEGTEPKIDDISEKIRSSLSKMLDVPYDRIGITATSGEGLQSFSKGMKCICMVLLKRIL